MTPAAPFDCAHPLETLDRLAERLAPIAGELDQIAADLAALRATLDERHLAAVYPR